MGQIKVRGKMQRVAVINDNRVGRKDAAGETNLVITFDNTTIAIDPPVSHLFCGLDDAIVAAQVHESEEAQQAIVVGIEIAVLEGHVLSLPESIDKLLALVVAAHHRGSSSRSHQTDAMTKLAETTGTEDLITLRQGAILAELIHKRIHALAVEEVLDGLAIPALPLTVGTAPLIVERNVHRYAPGVVTEVVVAIARRCLRRSVLLLTLRSAREAEALHLRAVKLALVAVQGCLLVYTLVEELTALLGTFIPEVAATIVCPLGPHLIESRDMIGRIGMTLSEAIGGESNQFCLGIDEIHLLRALLLLTATETATTEAAKAAETAATGLWCVLLRLNTVQDALGLSLVVDARVITPTIRGKDKGGDEIQLTVAGSTWRIAGTIGAAAPGKIALTDAVLVLHILLSPAPQTVEDIFPVELHGNHHAIRHTLGTRIMILDIGNIAHRVANLEIDLIRTEEHIVKHFLHLGIDFGLRIAHLHQQVTVLVGLKRSFLPRSQRHCGNCQQQRHHNNYFSHKRYIYHGAKLLRIARLDFVKCNISYPLSTIWALFIKKQEQTFGRLRNF